MNNTFKHRFIERDYLFAKMKKTSAYITDTEINNILDEMQDSLCDVTFSFRLLESGFTTSIIDNNSNTTIFVDDLNTVAFDFYINKVQEISLLQMNAKKEKEEQLLNNAELCIQKIRKILSKEDKLVQMI